MFTKKTKTAMASQMHESAAPAYSDFAKKMLEKFGWSECVARALSTKRARARARSLSLTHTTDTAPRARARRGQGLGKNEDGISRSIKVAKREDNVGVSRERRAP